MKKSKRDEVIEERRIQRMINGKNHPNEDDLNADDGYDWDAIEAYGKEVLAEQNEQLAYQSGADQVAGRLEEKYAAESLKFTRRFNGVIPLVACGSVFGQYFYFRFRGDNASLRVGLPDVEGNLDRYHERVADREADKAKAQQEFENGKISQEELKELIFINWISHEEPPRYDIGDIYPDIVHKSAFLEDVTGEPYSSDLTFEQMEETFIYLMENLERHDPPINLWERI